MTFTTLLSCSSLSLNTDPWTHPHPLHCVLHTAHTHRTLVNQQLLCTSYLSLPVKQRSLTDRISAAWGHRPTPSSTHCCRPEGRLSGGVFRLSGFSTLAIYTSTDWMLTLLSNAVGANSGTDRQAGRQTAGEMGVVQPWTQRHKHTCNISAFKRGEQHLDKYFKKQGTTHPVNTVRLTWLTALLKMTQFHTKPTYWFKLCNALTELGITYHFALMLNTQQQYRHPNVSQAPYCFIFLVRFWYHCLCWWKNQLWPTDMFGTFDLMEVKDRKKNHLYISNWKVSEQHQYLTIPDNNTICQSSGMSNREDDQHAAGRAGWIKGDSMSLNRLTGRQRV